MGNKVFYSDEAKIDIHRAKCYLDFYDKGADFLNDLFHQEDVIRLMPEAFQIRYRNQRIIKLSYFEYYVLYSVQNNSVYIQRVTNQIYKY